MPTISNVALAPASGKAAGGEESVSKRREARGKCLTIEYNWLLKEKHKSGPRMASKKDPKNENETKNSQPRAQRPQLLLPSSPTPIASRLLLTTNISHPVLLSLQSQVSYWEKPEDNCVGLL